MAIALHLVAHRADHLAVAAIAAFADVDAAPFQLQGRVGAHPFDLFDGVFQVEQRHDLHQTADGYDQKRQHQKKGGMRFDYLVFVKKSHV